MPVPLVLAVTAPAVRAQARPLAAGAGLALVRVGTALARPWPLAFAVDRVIDAPAPSPAQLAIACLAVVALSGIAGLAGLAGSRCTERAAERIGARLRFELFDHALSRSLRWHDRLPADELVARLTTDVGRMLDAIVALTATLLPGLVLLAGVLVVLATLSPVLALIGVAVIAVLVVVTGRQRRRLRASRQRASAESGRLTATTTDLLRNIRAVHAFGRDDRASAAFAARNRALLDVELRAADTAARWSPLADLVLASGAGLMLFAGGRAVLTGTISTGELLVVLAYLRDLYSPVRALTRLSGLLADASASAARVREVLDARDTVPDLPHAGPAPLLVSDVRLERVGFGYDPDRRVLHEVSLRVPAGETVALTGPSRSGKSTVLHLLLRLYDVDSGAVLLDGVDLRHCQRASLRDRISLVPQDPWFLDATLAENIAFGSRTATRAGVLAAGRTALLDEFAAGLPAGYDTPLGVGGARLRPGQRVQVALARAAVSDAALVLLDEPTAGLDPLTAELVRRAIRAVTERRTVLLVTDDPELAAVADRVVALDDLRGGEPHAQKDSAPQAIR